MSPVAVVIYVKIFVVDFIVTVSCLILNFKTPPNIKCFMYRFV